MRASGRHHTKRVVVQVRFSELDAALFSGFSVPAKNPVTVSLCKAEN
jgi:hypothetical protein